MLRYRYLILSLLLLMTHFYGPTWSVIFQLAVLGFMLGLDVHSYVLKKKLTQWQEDSQRYEAQQKYRLRELNRKWGKE